jgi:hypothetical protein
MSRKQPTWAPNSAEPGRVPTHSVSEARSEDYPLPETQQEAAVKAAAQEAAVGRENPAETQPEAEQQFVPLRIEFDNGDEAEEQRQAEEQPRAQPASPVAASPAEPAPSDQARPQGQEQLAPDAQDEAVPPQAEDDAEAKVRATERAIAEAQIEREQKLEAERQARSDGGKPRAKVGDSPGATASPVATSPPGPPTSQTLENSETAQVEKMAAELERLRKLMAERETQEVEEAKVPAPPSQRRASDPVRQGEIKRALEAVLAGFPPPLQIVFDPKDVDAPVPTIKAFGEAAEKCSEYSYAFGGLGAVYHWRRGECFVAIERILAPQGQWGEWYRGHGFDKSEVSRDRRLFLACPHGDKVLIGYSEAAAHRKFVAKKKPKTEPSPGESPAAKEERARSDWLPFVPPEKDRIIEGKPCRHKIGALTSVQVANFLAYLRKFNTWLDALEFQITTESLKEMGELLEAVKQKLPKE